MTSVIIIIVYGITVIKVNFNADKQSQELVQGLVQIPFVSPDVVFDENLSQFFTALDKVFAELKTKADLSTYGDVFVFRYVPVSTIESCARYFSHSDERVGDSTGLVFIICIITHPPPSHHHQLSPHPCRHRRPPLPHPLLTHCLLSSPPQSFPPALSSHTTV